MKQDPLRIDLNFRVPVDSRGNLESVYETLLEVVNALVGCPELDEQGFPTYVLRCGEKEQEICNPAVDIEGLGVIQNGPDGRLFEGHRMFFQLLEESFRKAGRLEK